MTDHLSERIAEYQFYKLAGEQIQFRVRAPHDASIVLFDEPLNPKLIYEVLLGADNNNKSEIHKNHLVRPFVAVATPEILSNDELRGFLISWQPGVISVSKEGQREPIFTVDENEIFAFHYFGIRFANGATGEWLIDARCMSDYNGDDPNAFVPPPAPFRKGCGDNDGICWCDASGGVIPPNAVEGGRDDEPLFVGRANHAGALIPGKVKASHGVCYVAWGGEEHGKPDYQVLCGYQPRWVPVSGGDIPSNAIPAGETEDGEPLFVGRVQHEGTVTIGKVQASHNVCYIPYGGSEVALPDYEILVEQ